MSFTAEWNPHSGGASRLLLSIQATGVTEASKPARTLMDSVVVGPQVCWGACGVTLKGALHPLTYLRIHTGLHMNGSWSSTSQFNLGSNVLFLEAAFKAGNVQGS